jgi:thiamine biosynthesis lipoprotein
LTTARLAARIVLVLLCAATSARAAAPCATDGRYVMGTILQLEICTPDESRRRDAFASSFAAAQHLDAILTTYVTDSPVSQLNAHAGEGARAVPPEVVELLASSRAYAPETGGTFDVTVGPLVALWRASGAAGRVPADDVLQRVRARVGSDRIVLGADGRSAALADAGMAVDFGGIGKGYALDRLAARLRASGIDAALLDFGRSSVRALGVPPEGRAWRLLLEHPSTGPVGVIGLRDQALSVSGSLAQQSEIGGRRYGHVIDPRTGRPLERDLLAAVVAPSAELAEALSKALLILGEGDGVELLERFAGVDGMLVDASGGRWTTRGWQEAVRFEPVGKQP